MAIDDVDAVVEVATRAATRVLAIAGAAVDLGDAAEGRPREGRAVGIADAGLVLDPGRGQSLHGHDATTEDGLGRLTARDRRTLLALEGPDAGLLGLDRTCAQADQPGHLGPALLGSADVLAPFLDARRELVERGTRGLCVRLGRGLCVRVVRRVVRLSFGLGLGGGVGGLGPGQTISPGSQQRRGLGQGRLAALEVALGLLQRLLGGLLLLVDRDQRLVLREHGRLGIELSAPADGDGAAVVGGGSRTGGSHQGRCQQREST